MTFVVGPSRNKVVQQAFAGLRRDERAKKSKPEPEAEPVKKQAVSKAAKRAKK